MQFDYAVVHNNAENIESDKQMSKSGIQSNRGDGYQKLIAFDWALTIISDTNYQSIEIDSVSVEVDDVVIEKIDGSVICCQCKKNHPQHKPWSINDLAHELRKAINLLTSNAKAEVRFYSRSGFGDISALREYSINYGNNIDYESNLSATRAKTNTELKKLLSENSQPLSPYDFLQRTTFETTPEIDRMRATLEDRLRCMVSNSTVAFQSIWTHLDHLGMRLNDAGSSSAIRHKLSKQDLMELLTEAGSILAPPMEKAEIQRSFESISAVGRSWCRHIGQETIPRSAFQELMAAIEGKCESILLTGLPGSGKTCVMLAAQDALEELTLSSRNVQSIFIQAREFSNFSTTQEYQAVGLPEKWVEKIARLAEDTHVVVMIDSLDVLSIAREHSALTFFLSQIDRLRLIAGITVVCACRDFDRQYDRRISQRTWNKTIRCEPLEWDVDIMPILNKTSIDPLAIDTVTRELIRNPREFSIFVELAQRGDQINAINSQDLTQIYLTTTIQEDSSLGDAAMKAMEEIANEMLISRSLAVPYQRFPASQFIRLSLLSNNILHKTQFGHIAFGHQTLLDVLVISSAIRQAVTLNDFIRNLPTVPFVRPSIRSFVAHLAAIDRRKLRAQLRTVLTSDLAFHTRRLVAETFADQVPVDDDWPLVRDLYKHHGEVFNIIYTRANKLEWHYFWMKHFIPILRENSDTDRLLMHGQVISQWASNDPSGVSEYWHEVLSLDGAKSIITYPIARATTNPNANHVELYAPLILELSKHPKQTNRTLENAIKICVESGYIDDAQLWKYIENPINQEHNDPYTFDQNIHCQSHDFARHNKEFIRKRAIASTTFIDLIITTIESRSHIHNLDNARMPVHSNIFLNSTSHNDLRSQVLHRHHNTDRILMDALEAAIIHHSNKNSTWWKNNRERLCFNMEDALRYFGILACTSSPHANLDIISHMLCDKDLLESSLSYETGSLMHAAFIYLNDTSQRKIQENILRLHSDRQTESHSCLWIPQSQAKLILAIPCHLRSREIQSILDECEKTQWPYTRTPTTRNIMGVIHAPFQFDIFLDASNDSILKLLDHYEGVDHFSGSNFLEGGEIQVGQQLSEAASRHPTRFLKLLSEHWERISEKFRNDLMAGVSTYLAYRHGNLTTRESWSPQHEADAIPLAQNILSELEKHPEHWIQNYSAAKAIESCAAVLIDTQELTRLISLSAHFLELPEPQPSPGRNLDLINTGLNTRKGSIAEALMTLANRLEESDIPWPPTLPGALRIIATDDTPAVRALLLRRLPHLQERHPELGWELLDLAMRKYAPGLWPIAESCLYYSYHREPKSVAQRLSHIHQEGRDKDLETWGRISALSALSRPLEFSTLLDLLHAKKSAEAWRGATSVWTHPENLRNNRKQCISGIEQGMNAESFCITEVTRGFYNIFRETTTPIQIPLSLLKCYFDLLETSENHIINDISSFDSWLNARSLIDPMYVLDAAEIYIDFAKKMQLRMHNNEEDIAQLLTHLFAQAEEQEELDGGNMLRRLVNLQDALLALGVDAVNTWLKAAERP